jgi:hypothetical protein
MEKAGMVMYISDKMIFLSENYIVDYSCPYTFVECILKLGAHHEQFVADYRRLDEHVKHPVRNVETLGGRCNGWAKHHAPVAYQLGFEQFRAKVRLPSELF